MFEEHQREVEKGLAAAEFDRRDLEPAQLTAAAGTFWRASMTWNIGLFPRSRCTASSETSLSKGISWWA